MSFYCHDDYYRRDGRYGYGDSYGLKGSGTYFDGWRRPCFDPYYGRTFSNCYGTRDNNAALGTVYGPDFGAGFGRGIGYGGFYNPNVMGGRYSDNLGGFGRGTGYGPGAYRGGYAGFGNNSVGYRDGGGFYNIGGGVG